MARFTLRCFADKGNIGVDGKASLHTSSMQFSLHNIARAINQMFSKFVWTKIWVTNFFYRLSDWLCCQLFSCDWQIILLQALKCINNHPGTWVGNKHNPKIQIVPWLIIIDYGWIAERTSGHLQTLPSVSAWKRETETCFDLLSWSPLKPFKGVQTFIISFFPSIISFTDKISSSPLFVSWK